MDKPCRLVSKSHRPVESPSHGVPPKETMIQLTQEALLALIHDASTRAAAQAMAHFAAQHPSIHPPPSPRQSRELSSAPEEEEQRQEEVNNQVSRPEVAQTQRTVSSPNRGPPTAPLPSGGVEGPYLALLVAPPRRSPFSAAIIAEALPAGLKVSNLSKYDGTGDPHEHLDKFYAKIDWYDLSDAAVARSFAPPSPNAPWHG
ncbi:UNVERIFIED_CONTAM: hypothetical protein Sangu_0988100 [Sesamum angustifolium]|uniref:Uncharacterized protein n=1 Tax=Sesamum angustifolium TaxID=2727405 RepID=A0AAW2PGG6_9LAMI